LPEGAKAIGSSVAERVWRVDRWHPSKHKTLAAGPIPSPRHFLRKVFKRLGLGVDFVRASKRKVLKAKELRLLLLAKSC
jgi:hypothetical protein